MASTSGKRRVVVLTGASSGIGRAAAVAFAERGDQVVLASRDATALGEAAAECERAGGAALAVPTDVSDEAAVTALATRAHERFGGIDAWVNAASVIVYGEFEKTPIEVYRQVLETNLFGQVYAARAVLPYFRERGGGVLVNMSSVWGMVSSPYVSSYVVSKFGIRAFSESLREAMRLEKATRNIRVCTILPQSVDTPIFRKAGNYTGHQTRPVPPVIAPKRVVRAIVRSVDHPRRQRTVGNWGRFLELGHALAPGLFSRTVPTAMNTAALGRRGAGDSPGNVFDPMPEWNREQGSWRNTPLRVGLGLSTAGLTGLAALACRRTLRRRQEAGS